LLVEKFVTNQEETLAPQGKNWFSFWWCSRGKGKSGGFRYMYYYIERDGQIFLLMVFNKNEQDNLTEKQKKTLSILIRELREEGR
jgi:hypothetical protein